MESSVAAMGDGLDYTVRSRLSALPGAAAHPKNDVIDGIRRCFFSANLAALTRVPLAVEPPRTARLGVEWKF
ncbi:MAG TPA: hypothetical protein VI424_03080 [Terriglobales bacterium]|jgi:hypothetical protein